jgi:hypothetical protein
MNKTLRIFDEDVVFAGDDTTGTAMIRYKNRDVVLRFIAGYPDDIVFINGKRFIHKVSTETFEHLLPQLIDEVIGVALGVNFCVKRSDHFWHYYADIEQQWEIESDSYPNTVTPSWVHWKRWVINSIEQKRGDQ